MRAAGKSAHALVNPYFGKTAEEEIKSKVVMAEKTTGRKKNSKKSVKPPIPIDTAVSQPSASAILTGGEADNTATTDRYPGIEEEIRQRAYELYEARGRQEGFQEEDWIRAETEILAKYRGKSA
jgi:hypothetical protein